jgi:DNA-binding CsgD family transcriptional regulator
MESIAASIAVISLVEPSKIQRKGETMRVSTAFADPVTSDVASALLAIGRASFPQVLMNTLRRIAGVGHCMVFTFEGERSARCLLDIGNIPTGPNLGSAYSEHFHFADPNRDAIFEDRTNSTTIILPTFARRMYSANYLKLFFEESAIIDKFATAIWVDRTCFYVNLYRTTSQGRFDLKQIANLTRIASTVGGAVARHFQDGSPTDHDPFRRLEAVFSTSDRLIRLTSREKEVCMRILSGFSSEAISAHLGISVHSTFTYRKRAYEKLGISSQNELFGLVLRALVSPRHLN